MGHPWLAARRVAERCSGSPAPSPLGQQFPAAPGALPSLLSPRCADDPPVGRGGGGRGGRTRHPAAARGSSAAAPGPTRGSGRLQHRGQRPAGARSAVQHRRGGQRRRPLSRLAGPGAPPRADQVIGRGPMVGLSCSSGAWRGRRGEESRPPRALPHAAPWSVCPEGDQRCLWG